MLKSAKSAAFRALSFLLCIFLLTAQLVVPAFAQGETATGLVTGDYVNIRTAPGTYDTVVITQVHYGQSVTVLGSEADRDGDLWYHISFVKDGTPYTGYIFNKYLSVIPAAPSTPPAENPDFETQLAAFPESYKAGLRAIHAQHPSWNFEAFQTNLDWNTVQSLENRLGWSYINDGIISHYSTAPGSYDWETDTYFVREGSNWYQAHPDMVAYFMDPRNFLNESELFQFEKLAFSAASQTEENIAAMMRGTFMEGKTTLNAEGVEVSYARAFLDAAAAANVSAFHLVTRCIQEVGWSGSACVHGSYGGDLNGYYNFFNIGANTGAYDGMVYAKNHGWNTPYKAIVAGGAFIGNSYIARGQDTPYFQKYNVVEPHNVAGHQYMTNVAAARSEGRIQRGKYAEMGFLETAFTFRIPVYLNLPESVCAAPAPAGSPNNLLKSLSVDGYSLTPSFDFYESLNHGVSSYSIIIHGNVSSLNLSAAAVSASATLSGHLGVVPIVSGENELAITCTAANGAARTYTIRVILNGQGAEGGSGSTPTPVPSGWDPPYAIYGTTLSGLTVGMSGDAFLGTLGTYGNARVSLTDESGNPFSGAMRTGLVLNYYDGTSTTQYRIVVFGDVNGDSAIDAIDLLLVRKHLLGLAAVEGAYHTACDVNHDGAVDAIDLLLVRKQLLGLYTITQ